MAMVQNRGKDVLMCIEEGGVLIVVLVVGMTYLEGGLARGRLGLGGSYAN